MATSQEDFFLRSYQFTLKNENGDRIQLPPDDDTVQPIWIRFLGFNTGGSYYGIISGVLIDSGGHVTTEPAFEVFHLSETIRKARFIDSGAFGHYRIMAKDGLKLEFTLNDEADSARLNQMISTWRSWRIIELNPDPYQKEDLSPGSKVSLDPEIGTGTSEAIRQALLEEEGPGLNRSLSTDDVASIIDEVVDEITTNTQE